MLAGTVPLELFVLSLHKANACPDFVERAVPRLLRFLEDTISHPRLLSGRRYYTFRSASAVLQKAAVVIVLQPTYKIDSTLPKSSKSADKKWWFAVTLKLS